MVGCQCLQRLQPIIYQLRLVSQHRDIRMHRHCHRLLIHLSHLVGIVCSLLLCQLMLLKARRAKIAFTLGVVEGFFGYNFPKPKLIWMNPGI